MNLTTASMKTIFTLFMIIFAQFSIAQCDLSFNTSFYSGFGVSCYGDCDGSITAVPTGSAPFSYSWSTGDTTQSLSGQCAGMYTLTMMDNTGCIHIDSITLTEPSELVASITILNPISQMGFCDGELASFSNGGVPNYSFEWFNCENESEPILGTPNAACAGEWGVVVTDLNGCADTACVALNWPNGDTCTFISENYELGGLDCAWGVFLTLNFEIDSFQWVNCDSSYAPFPGDVGEFYSSEYGGNVAVVIYAYGCIDTSFCHDVCTYSIEELPLLKKKLIKIVDLSGRETKDEPNTLLIFIYDDGTVEKKYRIE